MNAPFTLKTVLDNVAEYRLPDFRHIEDLSWRGWADLDAVCTDLRNAVDRIKGYANAIWSAGLEDDVLIGLGLGLQTVQGNLECALATARDARSTDDREKRRIFIGSGSNFVREAIAQLVILRTFASIAQRNLDTVDNP